jgi:type IX secretion system PorP/SprF family membrane protein
MRKVFISILLLALVIISPYEINAQQQVIYDQYMFNGLVINPAYAGQHESISLMALYRMQWLNVPGAPSTIAACLHSPLKNKKAGVGVLFTNDNIGVTTQTAVNLYFSYRIFFNNGAKLSFGLQGGFTQYHFDYSKLTFQNKTTNDPAFNLSNQNFITPNFGFGVYYTSKKIFAGLSVPQIMQHYVNDLDVAQNAVQLRYYMFYGGYLWKISPNLLFKPNTLIKFSPGVPFQVDVNAALLIRDALWVMLSYRSVNTLNATLQLNLNESLSLGYSYEQPVGGYSVGFGGTHEIMLNYRFKIATSDIVNPRYF